VEVNIVEITDEYASERIGKPVGRYVTLHSEAIRTGEDGEYDIISSLLQEELSKLAGRCDNVLVVGLGNRAITPDALGPMVAEKIFVTRHLNEEKIITDAKIPSVSAISPGVLGTTGIETGEIIHSVTERIKPDVVIAIDALAAGNIGRVTSTIQISDTGIIPGSGVGNRRNSLTEDTLGVPVIAIGVPTVVDAATVANDALDILTLAIKENVGEDSALYKSVSNLENENRVSLIKQVLQPFVGNLIVTPTEIDSVIDHISCVIADAVNRTFVGDI
jgi:spore protease